MGIRKPEVIIIALIVQWIFTISLPCIGETEDDLVAVRELLLTFREGYEQRDVDKYISVFSDREFEYFSDNATPDDPSDDIRLTGVESERRSAIRVFGAFENIDLEMTELEVKIDGDSAEARSEIEILVVHFKKPNAVESYYGASLNTFYLKKTDGEWRIIRWHQRESSAEELAARRQKEPKNKGVEELIQDLRDDRLGTWSAAMVALGRRREESVKPLIEALGKPDRDTKLRAAMVLYGTRDEGAIQALVEMLEDPKNDVDVRIAAITALGECDGHEVDKALTTAAKVDEPQLRAAAFIALAQRARKKTDDVQRIAVVGLRHGDAAVREAAAESLGIIMSTLGADLLEQLFRSREEPENVRLTALKSLKQIKTDFVLGLFRDALKDRTEATAIRVHSAIALGEAKDHNSVELLADVARSKEETFELRRRAIAALGATGVPEAAVPLIDLLKVADADLRGVAVVSLGQLGDDRAMRPLIKIVESKDEDVFVRRSAGRGIVKMDRDTAFGPLARIMKDKTESAPVRRMAAEKLRSFRDERPLPLFAEVLKDRESPLWLRKIALGYLTSVSHIRRFRHSDEYMEALKIAAADADEEIAKKAQKTSKELETSLADELHTTSPQLDTDGD